MTPTLSRIGIRCRTGGSSSAALQPLENLFGDPADCLGGDASTGGKLSHLLQSVNRAPAEPGTKGDLRRPQEAITINGIAETVRFAVQLAHLAPRTDSSWPGRFCARSARAPQ